MLNGGEIIVEYLAREKVPYVFGLCGHGNVGLLDALYDRTDTIRTISTRHEQTAGHMADAYFRVAHRPVATLTSCGPGSTNIPHDELAARLEELESRSDRPIVVYCKSGKRAGMAANVLVDAGYANVQHLVGDMDGWRASGRPIEPVP